MKAQRSSFYISSVALSGLAWICCLGLLGCANPKSAENIVEKQLIGDWEAVAAQMTFNTEGGTVSSRSLTVSEGEWESHQNRTPPKMTYFADHRYSSKYVSLVGQEGEQVHDTVAQIGTWALHGDTLIIQEPNLSIATTKFTLKLDGDRLELSSTMDMDMDGAVDDTYWMLQRRRK
jgi:hypothetical protein